MAIGQAFDAAWVGQQQMLLTFAEE